MEQHDSTEHRQALEQAKQEVVERFGPWQYYNIHLGDGVYTMERGLVGPLEMRVQRMSQIVSDLLGDRLRDSRILDLGAHEAGFAIDLALRGAEVLALEGRDKNVAKAKFAKEALTLSRLSIQKGDVRDLDPAVVGHFDVVLCLGLLYHLDASEAVPLLEKLASLCSGFMVLETVVSLSPKTRITVGDKQVSGKHFRDPTKLLRGSQTRRSFVLTKPSLFNLLRAAGFSSVLEIRSPMISEVAAYQDGASLVAAKGKPLEPISTPELKALPDEAWTWPEKARRKVTPAQGTRHMLKAMIDRARGKNPALAMFGKRRLRAGSER